MVQPRQPAGVCLLCRVGALVCALPVEHIRETMRALPVEPLAGAPAFVLGLSIIRGAAVPVVSVAALVGSKSAVSPMRFVTLAIGERHVALAVDAVIGIRPLDATETRETPPLLIESVAEVVSAIGHLDAELLYVLRGARFVPDSVWQAVEAGADRHDGRA